METRPHVCVAVQERRVGLEREVHEPQAVRLVPLRDDHPARDVRRAHVDDPVVRWGCGGVEPLEVREGGLAAAFGMAGRVGRRDREEPVVDAVFKGDEDAWTRVEQCESLWDVLFDPS